MTEGLVKKLFRAGFQSTSRDGGFAAPELSELIKGCVKLSPQGDFHLEHLYSEWGATTCYLAKKSGGKEVKGKWHDDTWFVGKSPEEAVAKLWLELKKNEPRNKV